MAIGGRTPRLASISLRVGATRGILGMILGTTLGTILSTTEALGEGTTIALTGATHRGIGVDLPIATVTILRTTMIHGGMEATMATIAATIMATMMA